MSAIQDEDWKLKAQAVAKLCSKKCDKSVSLSVLCMINVNNNFSSSGLLVRPTRAAIGCCSGMCSFWYPGVGLVGGG